jgi:hypothetical protein
MFDIFRLQRLQLILDCANLFGFFYSSVVVVFGAARFTDFDSRAVFSA